MEKSSFKCAEFSPASNDTRLGLILCILSELEPFEVSMIDKSEKVPCKV